MSLKSYKHFIKKTIITGCLFLCLNSFAQNEHQRIFNKLVNVDFTAQSTDLRKESKLYFYAYSKTIEHLLFERVNYATYDSIRGNTVESLNEINNTTDIHFYIAQLDFFGSLAALRSGREIESAWLLRKSYKRLAKNLDQHPDHTQSLMTFGALQLLLGAIPEKYQWLISLSGMSGNISEGMSMIDRAITKNISEEATIYKAILQTFTLNVPYDGIKTISRLQQNAPLLDLIEMMLHFKAHNAKRIISIFEEISYVPLPSMHYLVAEAYMQMGNDQVAIRHYQAYLKKHQGPSNKTDCYFKLSLLHQLAQDHRSKLFVDSVLNYSKPKTQSDHNAFNMADKFSKLNYEMLRFRYAIDGGAYKQALQILPNIPLKSHKDSVELVYRNARMNHLQSNLDKAIAGYNKTIRLQKNSEYFAPNAALMLGDIHFKNGRYDSASIYFRKVKKYKNYQYENSINMKAEARLNQIKYLLSDQ